MPNGKEKSAFERIGREISSRVADVAANPLAQVGVIVICVAWFALGLETSVLTAMLSILAISLTQMVLSRQNERESDAHRRDIAMHAKLDELVITSKLARNEMAGIENLEEEEIQELKVEAKQIIDDAVREGGNIQKRDAAKKAIDVVSVKLKAQARPKTSHRKRAASARK